jgi:PIN domain nuclease of toxin-antitoxin system
VILAYLRREPLTEDVEALFDSAIVSSVNLSEVFAVMIRRGAPPEEVYKVITDLDLHVKPFDSQLARRTAELVPLTAAHGLSLGDRACVATAQQFDAIAVTLERQWDDLPFSVKRIVRKRAESALT